MTHWAGGGQVFNIYKGRIFFQDSDVQNKYQIICNNEHTSIHSQNDGKVMLLKSEQQHRVTVTQHEYKDGQRRRYSRKRSCYKNMLKIQLCVDASRDEQ